VRDATQRHDNGVLGQQAQLVRQEFVAIIYLGTDRLVIRRQTFDGIGNAAVDKLEVVTGRLRMVAASGNAHPARRKAAPAGSNSRGIYTEYHPGIPRAVGTRGRTCRILQQPIADLKTRRSCDE
jgi:hypothetical protein